MKLALFLHQLSVRTHMASRWHPSRNEDPQMMNCYTYQWVSLGYSWLLHCHLLWISCYSVVIFWLSVNENVKRVIEASEIKQKTYLFFAKLGNYSSSLKFWNRLIMWALPLTTYQSITFSKNDYLNSSRRIISIFWFLGIVSKFWKPLGIYKINSLIFPKRKLRSKRLLVRGYVIFVLTWEGGTHKVECTDKTTPTACIYLLGR